MTLQKFRDTISTANPIGTIGAGVIGEGLMIPGSQGDVPLIYADYVASGRAIRQVEDFVTEHVLPFYANSHTEDSYCGGYITRLREDARAEIARLTNTDDSCSVIFAGSGATAGLNRLVALLGVEEAENPVIFIGPYEHHSNILPWRESKAKVVEIPEGEGGGPDLILLYQALQEHQDSDLKIGSFSAASNVTGIVTDTDPITRILKDNGALSIWDYAGGGPYLSINMASGSDVEKDAVVLSPHKFPGGPGSSGVLILRKSIVKRETPSWPGGGTVAFVSPWEHDYSNSLSDREEAGTPNIIGDIRSALVFIIKDVISQDVISKREHELNERAFNGWSGNPQLNLLAAARPHRLPIFSFLVTDANGEQVDPQLFTRLLSDLYGIQARGGCACAGPYGHRLLDIGHSKSDELRCEILAGNDVLKPGWVRLNFSYLMDDKAADYIIDSVNDLTNRILQGQIAA